MWTSGTTWYADHEGEQYAITVGEAADAQAKATAAGLDPETFKPLLAGQAFLAAQASPGQLLHRAPEQSWAPFDPAARRPAKAAPADAAVPTSSEATAPVAEADVTATES